MKSSDDSIGLCPICRTNDGFINAGRTHVGYCKTAARSSRTAANGGRASAERRERGEVMASPPMRPRPGRMVPYRPGKQTHQRRALARRGPPRTT
jgi:hypothetical protein